MKTLHQLFNPHVFQGTLNKKGYFEGWYHKHSSRDGKSVFSIIPGISLGDDSHCFIQFIDNKSGETAYFRFNLEKFNYDRRTYSINIDNNQFSRNGFYIDICQRNLTLKGYAVYTDNIFYPGRIISPGIMGPFSFIPFMECNHGIVSINHKTSGHLKYNDHEYLLNNDAGYIEKDWGSSFPEEWIWLQANNFKIPDICIMASIAKIPWLGSSFYGFLCFLYLNGKLYRFMTYNFSRIRKLGYKNSMLTVHLKNNKYLLEIDVLCEAGRNLAAPINGKMDRIVKESINSRISFTLKDKTGNIVAEDSSHSGGLEISGNIIENTCRHFKI
ncbi:MAG: hypothetical protein JW982_08230 [Spirochaetes bacterium]|nr:hypothetical protein [Spirochaetota bacterium]